MLGGVAGVPGCGPAGVPACGPPAEIVVVTPALQGMDEVSLATTADASRQRPKSSRMPSDMLGR